MKNSVIVLTILFFILALIPDTVFAQERRPARRMTESRRHRDFEGLRDPRGSDDVSDETRRPNSRLNDHEANYMDSTLNRVNRAFIGERNDWRRRGYPRVDYTMFDK